MAKERINLNAGNYRFFCLNNLGLIALNDKLAILRLESYWWTGHLINSKLSVWL